MIVIHLIKVRFGGTTFETRCIELINLSGNAIEKPFNHEKIILSYCRVSTSEQSTDGAGLDNQQHANNIAINQLQANDSYIRLEDIIEVGSAYKGNNLIIIIDNAKAGLYPKDSIIVMFDQIKDINLANSTVFVFRGKVRKDRYSLHPQSLHEQINIQIQRAKKVHQKDLNEGFGLTSLPPSLIRKYNMAAKDFSWQYLFPSSTRCEHPHESYICRLCSYSVDAVIFQRGT